MRVRSESSEPTMLFSQTMPDEHPPTPPPSRWPALITLPTLAKFQLVWCRLCCAVSLLPCQARPLRCSSIIKNLVLMPLDLYPLSTLELRSKGRPALPSSVLPRFLPPSLPSSSSLRRFLLSSLPHFSALLRFIPASLRPPHVSLSITCPLVSYSVSTTASKRPYEESPEKLVSLDYSMYKRIIVTYHLINDS